ncbi:MAG: hypothetical protein ABJL71_18855 [Cyclobacteriaceae bacterium]
MRTVFNAIKAALELPANQALFTDEGLTAPASAIIFSKEYQEEEVDHIPPRPYLSIEFGRVEWQTEEGAKEGDLPVTVHVVQDTISFREKQEALLQLPEIVVEILDRLSVSGDVLVHKDSDPDHDYAHYFVSKENFEIRVTRGQVEIPALIPDD